MISKQIIYLFIPLAISFIFALFANIYKNGIIIKTRLSDYLEIISLKILLPIFVIESLSKVPVGWNLLFAIILGFLLPLFTYLFTTLYCRVMSETKFLPIDNSAFTLLISTFGGGNRGTILLIIIFGASINFSDYLKFFSFVDLGNFMFLLLIIPLLTKKSYGSKVKNKISILNSYLFILALLIATYFIIVNLFENSEVVIENYFLTTRGIRKTAFSIFVFTSIFIRMNVKRKNISIIISDVVKFYFIRTLIFIPILFLFSTADSFQYSAILISLMVLLYMPPSSIFPSMFSQSNNTEKSLSYVNSFSALSNIIYLLILLVVFISRVLFL